jgi:hypothetical protein
MIVVEAMLTTIDNPYHPFDEFEAWYAWDEMAGYHTPSYLARITVSSDSLSDKDILQAIEDAVDLAVRENILGIYKKVTREVPNE